MLPVMVLWFSVQVHWTVHRTSVLKLQNSMSELVRIHDVEIESFSDRLLQYEHEVASWKSRYETLETQSNILLTEAAQAPKLLAKVQGTRRRHQQASTPTAALLQRGAFLALGACSAGEAQLCRSVVEFPSGPADNNSQGGVGHPVSRELRSALADALSETMNRTHDGLKEVKRAYAVHLDDSALRRCESHFMSTPALSVQLRAFAHRVFAHGPGRRIVYTVADRHYQRGLADIALNYRRTCDVVFFLCVALDKSTAVHACALGLNSVLYATEAGVETNVRVKKQQIYGAKYGVLAVLLDLGLDVSFGEMDVWLLGDPIRGIPIRDVAIGVHQDNPYNLNAGWIHVQRPRQSPIFTLGISLDYGMFLGKAPEFRHGSLLF